MNLLIGTNALSSSLVQHYWKSAKVCDSGLEKFVHRDSKFLSEQECKELHRLTYLNAELPFGHFDKVSTVGMVATNPEYCENFNKDLVLALKRVGQVAAINSLMQIMVHSFVPLTNVPGKMSLRSDGSGKSCHWLKGAIFASAPVNHAFQDLEFSLNIVHELGHQILMVFQDADLVIEDLSKPVYSSVRRTERPAIMSFHALVAVYFMLYFFSELRKSADLTPDEINYVDAKIGKLRADFSAGAFALRDIKFTPVGLLMMNEMINFGLTFEEAA